MKPRYTVLRLTLVKFVAAVLTYCISQAVFGKTLDVPSQYASIQDALTAAGQCDTIFIDSGTYSGPGFRELYFSDSLCVSIMSRYGADATIIDLEQSYFCDGDPGAGWAEQEIVIMGLHLRNGRPAIRYCRWCEMTIAFCRFSHCGVAVEADDYGGAHYGGVFFSDFRDNDTGISGIVEPWLRVGYCSFTRNYDGITGGTLPSYDVFNCTFVNNALSGYRVEGLNLAFVYRNSFHGNGVGILSYGPPEYWINRLECNNLQGNLIADYWGLPSQTGINGNTALDPHYCDTSFNVSSISPLLAMNNSCGQLIGSKGNVNCYCGDVDVSGNVDISDVTAIISYLYLEGPPPVPFEAGEIDGESGIDISDLTYLIGYLFISGPEPPCGT